MLFWCICIGYAQFHSHYILVEDPGIPVTLLAHREIPGGIPQVAAFQLHLCICSENQLCPKPSISPSSSRHRKTTLNLYVAVSHSWKMNYCKLGNLCSSKWRDVMAAVKITAVPQRQSSAMFGFQQPGTEKGERSPSRTGRHQKCLYLTCGLLDKLPLYQPTTQSWFLEYWCKNEVLGGHVWFK